MTEAGTPPARSRVREWALIALVAVAAAAAGYGYNWWRIHGDAGSANTEALSALAATRLPDLDNRLQAIDQWRGKVVVVNFWATWCAPCREEIPLFVKLQDKYRERGLQFVGVAIDQPDKVRSFAAEFRMNFPVVLGRVDTLDLTRKLGNKAAVLPYTVILDRQGKVAATQIGTLKEERIESLLAKLL